MTIFQSVKLFDTYNLVKSNICTKKKESLYTFLTSSNYVLPLKIYREMLATVIVITKDKFL